MGFSHIFKRSSSSSSPDRTTPSKPVEAALPTSRPLWARATEPDLSSKRQGVGPRSPPNKSLPATPPPRLHGPRKERPLSTNTAAFPTSSSGCGGDLNGNMGSLSITLNTSSTSRGPLPPPPPRRPPAHHQRAYSTPPPLVQSHAPGSPPHPSNRDVSSSPPKSRGLVPPPMARGAGSWSGTPSASYQILSKASTSCQDTPLYPQALPRPPLPPRPSPPQPYRPNADLFRQAVVPPSTTDAPSTANSPQFPGAFPAPYSTADTVILAPKTHDGQNRHQVSASPLKQSGHPTTSSTQSAPPPSPPNRPPPAGKGAPNRHLVRPAARTPGASAIRFKPVPSKPDVIDLCSSDDESSSAPSPTPILGAKNQCHGTTAAGKRCTRIVDSLSPSPSSPSRRARATSPAAAQLLGGSTALDVLDDMLGTSGMGDAEVGSTQGAEEGTVPRFCFQHSKQAMQERGCFVAGKGPKGEWIEFDDWILADLPVVTKILLRHEMARPVSAKDEEGFIYCHEMVERRLPYLTPDPNRTTYLKLGRSVKPVARLSQWRSQCPTREPIVRDIFPRVAGSALSAGAGLGGALQIAPRGVQHHHRWERMVLIEVAGRAAKDAEARGETGGRKRKECRDCGKDHVELFEVGEGAYEEWVCDVVERWMRWCRDILG